MSQRRGNTTRWLPTWCGDLVAAALKTMQPHPPVQKNGAVRWGNFAAVLRPNECHSAGQPLPRSNPFNWSKYLWLFDLWRMTNISWMDMFCSDDCSQSMYTAFHSWIIKSILVNAFRNPSIFRSFGKYNGWRPCWRPVVSPHSSCSRSGDRSPNTARGGQRFSRVPVEHEIDCGNLSMTISAVGMTICMIDSWYHFILFSWKTCTYFWNDVHDVHQKGDSQRCLHEKWTAFSPRIEEFHPSSQMFHRPGFGSGSQVSVLHSLTCFACLLYLLWANKALGAEISWVPQCHHDVPLDSWRSSNIFTH